MVELRDIAKLAFDGLTLYRDIVVKRYQCVKHVLLKESEVLVPSNEESYYFDRDVWNMSKNNEFIVLKKRK